MDWTNQVILIGATLLAFSILASAVSGRIGAPVLLVFLALGMLAGEDGPGGIVFHDVQIANLVGSIALGIILFDGGMRTRAETFRVGLRPALSLATVGVVLTTGLIGLFAAWVLDLPWIVGLLFGAIVGSTDAAAVFSLLHAHGMRIKERVSATLEIESGTNDPMAVFLTIALIHVITSGNADAPAAQLLTDFLRQLVIGGAGGVVGGFLLVRLLNALAIARALYPLLAASGALVIFATTSLVGGSGFLAIYLAGLRLGNTPVQAHHDILRVHDGLAWLSQICMFLLLGLLATPTRLIGQAAEALLLALALIFVARPLAVWVSLLPFRFPLREQAYVAWVGLRGAVPIILATFPLLAGLEHGLLLLDMAFFVVLVSLVLQGWTLAPIARRLGLEVPPQAEPLQRLELDAGGPTDIELIAYRVLPGSGAINSPPNDLGLPRGARVSAVLRERTVLDLRMPVALREGDLVYVLAPAGRVEAVTRVFEPVQAQRRSEAFFGEFAVKGDALVGDLAAVYGFEAPQTKGPNQTLADYLHEAFNRRPVVGDRLQLGTCELVVREIQGERISQVGLKLGH